MNTLISVFAMDLAIRIELYMNFAITQPEKSELLVRSSIHVTAFGKVTSEALKLSGIKRGIKGLTEKYICRNK